MHETIELSTAGQVVHSPLGATISLPYLPWAPSDIQNLTEDEREMCLTRIREQRDAIIKSITK